MPVSLKSKLKKLRHCGNIDNDEYDALLKKLDGHDKELILSMKLKIIEKLIVASKCTSLMDNSYSIPLGKALDIVHDVMNVERGREQCVK